MVTITEKHIWTLLEEVSDPEIPVISVVDLGIVREVNITNDGTDVVITPTYSGCPAMKTIEMDILVHLKQNGIDPLKIRTVLSPAWTTDWLSENGRIKLEDYGIAAPVGTSHNKRVLFGDPPKVACPLCKSEETEMISEFGSTPCKSHYKCKACLEPFDYFKCH